MSGSCRTEAHAPPQPSNVVPVAGVAVRVTGVPLSKSAAQTGFCTCG